MLFFKDVYNLQTIKSWIKTCGHANILTGKKISVRKSNFTT